MFSLFFEISFQHNRVIGSWTPQVVLMVPGHENMNIPGTMVGDHAGLTLAT